MVYKFKSNIDFLIATANLTIVLPYILKNAEKLLLSHGFSIEDKYYFKRDDEVVVPVLQVKSGKFEAEWFLRNAIDEAIFVDRDAEYKEAIIYNSKEELYSNMNRVLESKFKTLLTARDYMKECRERGREGIKDRDLEKVLKQKLPKAKIKVWTESKDGN